MQSYVTVFQSSLMGIFFMILILLTKNNFSVLFTTDKELQQAVVHLAYLLGATMLLNSVQPVISGVAIGGGRQATVAYINLGCYYVFGIPLGYLLSHVADFGVMVFCKSLSSKSRYHFRIASVFTGVHSFV
ncbi:hypothetical protein ACLB2K_051112 [Fragaria x ananassa]